MELQNHLFTVSELNQVIKSVLESSFFDINLEGEISNFRPAASGHWYFSLKDRESSISAVMFKNSSYSVGFKPKDGMKVKVKGKLTLYSQRGTYQIVCNSLKLFGEGDILVMLEERKRKLASLGYFDTSRKKLLPRFPKTIGIVTSPTGAALQDILKVLNRRHSLSNVIIFPTLVQGLNAHKTITSQLIKANNSKLCDVIILTRGGGSLEDLLPFSEEEVIKAIDASEIPVITGVGHEIDTSLADLAADFRAATPSAAAEIVTEGAQNLYLMISQHKKEILFIIKSKLNQIRNEVSKFNKKQVKRFLESLIAEKRLHLDRLKNDISSDINWKLNRDRTKLTALLTNINSLSPYALFTKGYSWVTVNGKNIMDENIEENDVLNIKYKNGDIAAQVKEKK